MAKIGSLVLSDKRGEVPPGKDKDNVEFLRNAFPEGSFLAKLGGQKEFSEAELLLVRCTVAGYDRALQLLEKAFAEMPIKS